MQHNKRHATDTPIADGDEKVGSPLMAIVRQLESLVLAVLGTCLLDSIKLKKLSKPILRWL